MRQIDADALKQEVKHRCVLSPLDAPWPLAYGNTDLPEIIDQMPTIEAEPKHGRWTDVTNYCCYVPIQEIRCSVCGEEALYEDGRGYFKTPYCPNCGARMDKE